MAIIKTILIVIAMPIAIAILAGLVIFAGLAVQLLLQVRDGKHHIEISLDSEEDEQ